jgi:phenylalanyl-tRNA synthetase alpha chain
MSDLKNIKEKFITRLNNNLNLDEINKIKSELFGKNGLISSQFKNISSILEKDRKKFASELNQIKDELQNLITNKINEIESKKINEKLEKEKIDITLPERPFERGKIHPVSQTIDEISSIFSEIGFSVEEGPDVENEYNNFTALNTPDNHPARDMHDTFYLDETKNLLLRTHTSPVQIRTMLKDKPPFKIIAPGRTYRSDSDQTHAPMFHQVEGLHIDKDINMGHLKGCLNYFIKEFFEVDKIKMRF